MKILIKEPGKNVRSMVIPKNDLRLFQQLVGGYIEVITLAEDAAIICNEEGRLLGLPYNCTILDEPFVGTILFVGVDGDEFTDVPDALVRLFTEEVRS